MNSKGQIVVPKAIRESLGIGQGWVALQGIEEHHVVVYFVPPDDGDESLKAMWPSAARRDAMDWHEVTELAWQRAACERAARLAEEEGTYKWQKARSMLPPGFPGVRRPVTGG